MPFLRFLKRPLCVLGLALVCVGLTAGAAEQEFEAAREAFATGDYGAALEIWQPLADGGDARALFAVGNLYERGLGVEQDDVTAVQYYRKAADRGLAAAQFNLGNAFHVGRGVPRDADEAVRYWRLAAMQDFPHAQFNLATQLYLGRGVARDVDAAVEWYQRAALNGHPKALDLFRTGRIPDPGGVVIGAATGNYPEPAGEPARPATGSEPSHPGGPAAIAEAPPLPVASSAPKATIAPDDEPCADPCLDGLQRDGYVIQLIALADEERIASFLAANQVRGVIRRCRILASDRKLTALLLGSYPDVALARDELETLPSGAWIRSVESLRSAVNAAAAR